MAFFHRKAKQEQTSCCACKAGAAAGQEQQAPTECGPKTAAAECSIKVLGTGCKSCHMLLEATKQAAQALGLADGVEYVTDLEKIMEYGAMSMPALVVNEQVVCAGKVLKAAQVQELLEKYL